MAISAMEVWSVRSSQIMTRRLLPSLTILETYLEFKEFFPEPLGFNERHLPDKQWLFNIAAFVAPGHPLVRLLSAIESNFEDIADAHETGMNTQFFKIRARDLQADLDSLIQNIKFKHSGHLRAATLQRLENEIAIFINRFPFIRRLPLN